MCCFDTFSACIFSMKNQGHDNNFYTKNEGFMFVCSFNEGMGDHFYRKHEGIALLAYGRHAWGVKDRY